MKLNINHAISSYRIRRNCPRVKYFTIVLILLLSQSQPAQAEIIKLSQESIIESEQTQPKETEPSKQAGSILQTEPWANHSWWLEVGGPDIWLKSYFIKLLNAGPVFNPAQASWMLTPDLALGLGLGVWLPQFNGLTLTGRYYLPDLGQNQLPGFETGRVYLQNDLALLFQIRSVSDTLGLEYSWGLNPQIGLEYRWKDYLTRYSAGFAIVRSLSGDFYYSPTIGTSFGVSPYIASEDYQQALQKVLERPAAPLFQVSLGEGSLEAGSLTYWLLNEHWGIGLFHSLRSPATLSNDSSMILVELPGQTLGLKTRYYPGSVHFGGQWFLQSTANLGNNPGIGLSIGLEHRELWGMVLDISLGIGIQVIESDHKTVTGMMCNIGNGFAWHLPTQDTKNQQHHPKFPSTPDPVKPEKP